jgi:hypothetical protein
MCDELVKTRKKFGILGNILGVTIDNAANMGSWSASNKHATTTTFRSIRSNSTCAAWPISQIWPCKHSCASWEEQKPLTTTSAMPRQWSGVWKEEKVVRVSHYHPSAAG